MLWKLQALCQKQGEKKKLNKKQKKMQLKYRNVTFKQPLRGRVGELVGGW